MIRTTNSLDKSNWSNKIIVCLTNNNEWTFSTHAGTLTQRDKLLCQAHVRVNIGKILSAFQ